MKVLFATAAIAFLCVSSAFGATQLSSVVGTVVSVDNVEKTVTIKSDQNQTVPVKATDTTVCLRIPAGARSLGNGAAIRFAEIATGDRVLARGTKTESDFTALRIVVLAKADLDQTRQQDLEEWRKRGIAGVVKSLNSQTAEISIEPRGSSAGSVITIDARNASFRRYHSRSINFEDTTRSEIGELSVGDQLRALVDKSEDGKTFKAQTIASGSVKTVGATVTAIDLQTGSVSATTLDQRKPIEIATLKETSIRRIPPPMVQVIAQKVLAGKPASATSTGVAPPRGPATPASQTVELQQLIESLPGLALTDLKVGDVVSVTGFKDKQEMQITAIKLVAGVDAVLRALTPAPGRPQVVRLSAGLPTAFDFSVIP